MFCLIQKVFIWNGWRKKKSQKFLTKILEVEREVKK